jgi:hypothetical protein
MQGLTMTIHHLRWCISGYFFLPDFFALFFDFAFVGFVIRQPQVLHIIITPFYCFTCEIDNVQNHRRIGDGLNPT